MTNDAKGLYVAQFHSQEYKKKRDRDFRQGCNFFDSSGSIDKIRNELSGECIETDDSKKNVLIWGDSHAQALSQGVRLDKKFNTIQINSSNCKPDIGLGLNKSLSGVRYEACIKANEFALEFIKKKPPEIVILAQANKHDVSDFTYIANQLKSYGVDSIMVVGPIIQLSLSSSIPKLISRIAFEPQVKTIPIETLNSAILVTEKNMTQKEHDTYMYVSLVDFLCEKEECIVKVDDNNTPLIFDYGHLTFEGSQFIFENYLKKVLESKLVN
ncbi:hypothetical protein GCM10027170_10270 [Aliiglaciecola aliphaticivorans]